MLAALILHAIATDATARPKRLAAELMAHPQTVRKIIRNLIHLQLFNALAQLVDLAAPVSARRALASVVLVGQCNKLRLLVF